MKTMKSMLAALAVSVFLLSCALIAQGASVRTFVSSTGSDGNTGVDCQPEINACRTFQAAIGQTSPGGQVVALDSTGYSAFSINKSITIEGAPGVNAFIFVGAGGAGITVTGVSTDLIVLRNIFVDGLGNASTTGLSFTGAAKLVVESCVFKSLTTGVSVAGTNNTTLPARMDLINSNFYGNGTAVVSNGSGANNPNNACCTASTSMVRINGGNITGNTVGLSMLNAGPNQQANIALFGPTGPVLNLVANGTNTTCSPSCSTFPFSYQTNSSFGP
jgi:hypothetical protein